MRGSLWFTLLLLSTVVGGSSVELPRISPDEASQPPSAARLAELAKSTHAQHWSAVADLARKAAFIGYGRGRLQAAKGWHYVSSWASLFQQTETEFLPLWIKAVESARVAHANMPTGFSAQPRAFGDLLSPELQRWMLGDAAFSEEFFSLITPVDYLPKMFACLNELHAADPAIFKKYAALALAIAVVYDVPPPPDWPHGQVTPLALQRRLPNAARAFAWWTREDAAGRTYHRLTRLGADELKFIVDATAPFEELEWSQKSVTVPLAELDQAYSMIKYRIERVRNDRPIWPGKTYLLSEILAQGGICVDQAYFAAQVGKARGVPTLLFRGAGLDGRHAWFGFLDGAQQWQLDAGRYAEQKFVTGLAHDPQTWRNLSDHELRFLAERFRTLPSYGQSRVHAVFASAFLRDQRFDEAAASARKAVNYERRNLAGWETLLAAQAGQGAKPNAIEATLREAALAFQRYPDLEVIYKNRLAASLRARGETSLADTEERLAARKYQATRSDLSVRQAAEILQRSVGQPLAQQISTYNQVVDTFGRGASVEFFDKIVVPFIDHLVQQQRKAEAIRALERARGVLAIEPGRQLDQEIRQLAERLKKLP